MSTVPDQPCGESRDLTDSQASQLLRMGISGPRRPVDDVIDRLGEPDGAEWFNALMATATGRSGGVRAFEDRLSVEELVAVKERAKTSVVEAVTKDEAAAATAAYFVAVAMALVHHGAMISSQPRDELTAVLADLAAAAAAPWAELLMEAALRLD